MGLTNCFQGDPEARKLNDNFTARMFCRLWGPAMLSSFGWALSDMADAVVVGQKLGSVGLAAIGLGSVLSAPFRKLLARLLPGPRSSHVCMVLSAACAFALVAPSQAVNFLGILLSGMFGNMVATEAGGKYMEDRRYVPLERPLVRLRIQTAGSILQQLVIFFTIYLLGEGWGHQNLLEAEMT